VSLKLYTPWKNIAGIGYGRKHRLQGLTLCEPAVIDVSVKEGIRQEIAVIELTRYTTHETPFSENVEIPTSFSR
ncbi:MAG TPA: hypothetical protein VFV38_07190, partial [Ktedonobacteraceae bacterium]|nr:hypothetical protein [Ktedonobacteraceae bacterium]